MKSFFHFNDGFKISDDQINKWIKECLARIINGSSHWSISSGDTEVIALKYEKKVRLVVANSSGRSAMSLSMNREGWQDDFERYVRAW